MTDSFLFISTLRFFAQNLDPRGSKLPMQHYFIVLSCRISYTQSAMRVAEHMPSSNQWNGIYVWIQVKGKAKRAK